MAENNGIEKVKVCMMRALFRLLILLLVSAMSKDGLYMAVEFVGVPDVSKISCSRVIEALGHGWFGLA